MTSLERQRRRKEKLAAFKSPLKKKLSKSHHLLKRVTIWRPRKLSPEQALLETKMEASSLSIDRNTATAIDNEVSDLLRDGKGSCTVLQMINAISSSRNVIDIYAKSAGIEDALTERRRFLGMTFGRRSNKSDAQMARRYVFIGAFNKLEIDPASSRKVITSLEEAREELRKVLDFPPEEAAEIPKESKELEEEVDIVTKYTKKIELSVQSDIDDELRPSQEKWQEIASVSLAPQIGKESQGLDKADSAMLRRLDDEYEKRNQRLKSAAVQEIEEQERAKLARERAAELMRPLTDEEQQLITEAMETIGPESEVIAQVGQDSCQRGSLRTLLPGQWLNDEVIHYFLVMLSKRDEEMCQQDPTRKRCHLFKSFFITKLLNEGNANPALDGKYEYRNVKRWSKKVPGKDIFSLDKIIFPINQGQMHWVCAVAYMQEKRVQFYDSMGADGMHYLEAILQYIKDEHQDKKKSPLPDADEWRLVCCTNDTPQQRNGYDCGVFTCMFADFISKDCHLLFNQNHVTQCRERIALSILNGKAIM